MDVYKMDAQVGLKTIALILFLNLFFYFLPAAALCHDFSLVDSVETYIAESNSNKNSWIGLANVVHLCTPEVHTTPVVYDFEGVGNAEKIGDLL